MIFTRSICEQLRSLLKNPRILGYSLRLHAGISGAPCRQVWEWPEERPDSHWGYPFDLTGTIYRTHTIKNMLANLGEINSPNEFESKGTSFMRRYLASHYPYLSSDTSPSCIIQQVNTVQTTFPGDVIEEHSPEELDEINRDG